LLVVVADKQPTTRKWVCPNLHTIRSDNAGFAKKKPKPADLINGLHFSNVCWEKPQIFSKINPNVNIGGLGI
jgi:hypothetical protein